MVIKEWDKEEKYYELGEGYCLERADNNEYSKYYGIYLNIDIGFKSSYEQKCSVVSDEDYCYWILKDGIRIAGTFLRPNYIEGLFTIPPFQDTYKVLTVLKKVLLVWSDKTKEITASVVPPSQVDYYLRLGFRIGEIGRWMIRPTAVINIEWNEHFDVRIPTSDDIEKLGELYFDAFKYNVGRTKFSLEERTSFVKYYFDHNSFNELLIQSSTIIYDKKSNELIGACLVSEFNGWPLIYDIAVKKSFRGKGLASRMIEKAISISSKKYPAIRLYVECGNDAEELYYNLGFMPGIKVTDLYIPKEIL